MKENLISHAATVIPVSDIIRSIEFYQSLGFDVTYRHGSPTYYAVLKAGSASIHLTLSAEVNPEKNIRIYIFSHDVEKFFEHCQSQGFQLNDLQDTDYEMKDFEVSDPDGHLLCFGEHTSR